MGKCGEITCFPIEPRLFFRELDPVGIKLIFRFGIGFYLGIAGHKFRYAEKRQASEKGECEPRGQIQPQKFYAEHFQITEKPPSQTVINNRAGIDLGDISINCR